MHALVPTETLLSKVSEEGARGGVKTKFRSMQNRASDRRVFNCNHPFVFLVQETRTMATLFMGRLINPQQEERIIMYQ